MTIDKVYSRHLEGSTELVTTYADYRTGFLAFALEKNKRSVPYIEEARALKVLSSEAKSPKQLLNMPEIQVPLLLASGVSDKAKQFLNDDDKKEAINNLIDNFLEPAGEDFIDELVYRYLLIKGDSFGGRMRNVAGVLAEQKITRAIISVLNISDTPYSWLDARNPKKLTWRDKSNNDYGIEDFTKGLCWNYNGKPRTIIYNVTVPLIKKNIDLCLFEGSPEDNTIDDFRNNVSGFLAFGELKGGIDPAGADEHWKTANSALNRIRDSFSKMGSDPYTFFIGAAIEKSMSKEIWAQLENDILKNAANLTKPDQVSSICNWLINI